MLWKVFSKGIQCALGPIKTVIQSDIFSKMPFYAVAKGRTSGIFMTWPDCEAQVKGFPGAKYKKFENIVAAQDFITSEGGGKLPHKQKSSNSRSSFGNTTSNLKRSFTTTSKTQNDYNIPNKKVKSKRKESTSDNEFEESDEINFMLLKQMDDIEKRLKGFEKGVDKIIKKNTKSDRKSILIEPQDICSNFQLDDDDYVQVYTDGACSANGRSGARAGLGVYWADGHPLNISEPVSGRATNNCGEIQAATRAIKLAINQGIKKLAINTDSKFLINSVTKWMPGNKFYNKLAILIFISNLLHI